MGISIMTIFRFASMFLLPLLAVLIPTLIGERYGINRKKKEKDIPHAAIGSVVGSAFGLLAFMLAFTFQFAANRYDTKRQLLLDEVTNIRTAYLRAGLIPEPFNSSTRKQLIEYVDLRVGLSGDHSKLDYVISRSQQILDSLWRYTELLAVQDRSSEVYALYTGSVNDIVALYNQRITMSLEYRIPDGIFWTLFLIGFFSMLVLGYQFGVSGKGAFNLNLVLSIIFAVVMFLILALDLPETGLEKHSQQPMKTLQQQLHNKQLNLHQISS